MWAGFRVQKRPAAVTTIPKEWVAAIGAWASLIVYLVLMIGFLDKVRDVEAAATTAPNLDAGLTALAALFGTAVVGVIAGLAGVSVARAGIRAAGSSLGQFLVAKRANMRLGLIAALAYIVIYFGIAVLALVVWVDRGTDVTPEFVRTQVLAAAGLVTAMAAISAA